jgi:hypothetical protein
MVHRVPIVSLDADNPQILSLLSQSDIISYIARHISVLGQRYTKLFARLLLKTGLILQFDAEGSFQ